MIILKYSIGTIANRDNIWRLWTDTDTWPRWCPEIEWIRLSQFQHGVPGQAKVRGGPVFKFIMNWMVPKKEFTAIVQMPLCKLHFHFLVDEKIDHRIVTLEVKAVGFLKIPYSLMAAPILRQRTPAILQNFVKMAEAK